MRSTHLIGRARSKRARAARSAASTASATSRTAPRSSPTSTAYRTDRPHLIDRVSTPRGTTVYSHDANGNVAVRSGPAGDIPTGTQSVQYTPFDLPSLVVRGLGSNPPLTRFEYSADEERVVRRDPDTTRYFVAGLYQRLTDTATGTTQEETFRLYAGGGEVAEIVRTNGADKTLFFHADHEGSIDTISTDTGDHFRQEFDAFGAPVDDSLDEPLTRAGFTGQQHDRDLGLIDMGGRIYDQLAGRFMSADPIVQAPFWSQGLNRYSYAFNDPINNVDPSGFEVTAGEVLGFSGFAAGNIGLLACANGGCSGIGQAFAGPGMSTSHAFGAGGAASGALATVNVAYQSIGIGKGITSGNWAGFAGAGHGGHSYAGTSPSGAPATGSGTQGSMQAVGQNGGGIGPAQQGYRTAWEAARGALKRYNPASILSKDPKNPLSYGNEYGGLIYERAGRYYFTEAVVGEEQGHVDPWETLDNVPEDARNRIVGDYHTHGGPNAIAEGEDFSGLHYEPGSSSPSLRAGSDIVESRNDLTRYRTNILDPKRYTSFLGTPSGRFGVYNPYYGTVFSFSPNPRLLPTNAQIPASSYSWH